MCSKKVIQARSTSVLNFLYGLLSHLLGVLLKPILVISGVVRRTRTGSIASQHYDGIIQVVNQYGFHSHTLKENRPAVEYDRKIFRQCILEGEQQAKCFTLALLVAVFVRMIY